MNHFRVRPWVAIVCLSCTSLVHASGFQLWEQDGASVGTYHAGFASAAEDASTAFYNPAGMVRINHQQFVVGGDPILTSFKFNGTVAVNTLMPDTPQQTSAQGGGFNFVPFAHYVAPINDRLFFGLSLVIPFGLQTNYGDNTLVRYAGTLSEIRVIDLTPSLAFSVTDQLSLGAGLDFERLNGQFDLQTGTALLPGDTLSENEGHDYATGYHVGALYQYSPQLRAGLSFHSQVIHHLNGTSKFIGPLANEAEGGTQESTNFATRIILPPTTSLGVFYTINPCWDVMANINYTQWSVVKNLVLHNVAGIQDFQATNNITVFINEKFRNTLNYSIGANYHLNEQWFFRMGGR